MASPSMSASQLPTTTNAANGLANNAGMVQTFPVSAESVHHEKHLSMSSTSVASGSYIPSPISPPPLSFNASTLAVKSAGFDSGFMSPSNQLQPNSPAGIAEETISDDALTVMDQKGRLVEHEKVLEYGGPSNRYGKLTVILGKGAYKVVWKAIDREEGIEVAWNSLQTTKSEFNELSQEIEILTKVRHQNVINFHDSWYNDGEFIFITELMTSGTLREYISKFRNPSVKIIKRWARQILKGLAHLHSHNPPIIHRDIKCDNIFVNGSHGEIKIGDMGTAKMKFGKKYTVIGTPEFMAPEMYEEKGYSEKVDIYAFGMCMLEMATGEYPYSECKNAAQIYKKVTQGLRPDCLAKVEDKELLSIINQCLSVEAERWSARRLLDYFFAEDPDVMLLSSDEQKSKLTLQVVFKGTEKQSIKFDFRTQNDTPEIVVQEMIDEGILSAKYQIHLTNEIYRIVREIAKPSPQESTHSNNSHAAIRDQMHGSEEQIKPVVPEARSISVRPMPIKNAEQQIAFSLNRMSLDAGAMLNDNMLSPVAQSQMIVKEYTDVVSIEEFISDVAVMTNRGLDKASEWLEKLKKEDIDTVGDLRKLQEEDWNRLNLSVFSCRAFKNALKTTPPSQPSGTPKLNASLLLANLSPRMTGRLPTQQIQQHFEETHNN